MLVVNQILGVIGLVCALTTLGFGQGDSPLKRVGDRDTAGPYATRPLLELQRGVNFGNMLEAPFEGAWGLTVQESFFDHVVTMGMDHIRLPVSWTHHASQSPPYTIDPVFMDRVAWCVDQALARDLRIIVNTHHYAELNADPAAERTRALSIWSQIAQRFRDAPDSVVFEVLNEPHDAFNGDPDAWNSYLADALAVIRVTNPDRWVMAGPVSYNSIRALGSFDPPEDPRFIATVHYYDPFPFTHQGASWVDPSPPVGTTWAATQGSFGAPWANWSWDTTLTAQADGVEVRYEAGWAGLFFRRDEPLANVRSITFTVDAQINLNLILGDADATEGFPVQTDKGGGTYTVDVPDDFRPIQRVMLQNASVFPQPPFTLTRFSVTPEDNPFGESPLTTAGTDIEHAIAAAAAWARDRNIPIYLGEFGAYSQADMPSRADWTRTVRRAAERHGIGWAYWELAAGFGVYDPDAGVFRKPLLNALTD